ncbi:hypothetical protein NBRC116592_29540 [Colwellia sp. KU-HH00111]|uniref:hypothetical protein n=1 Tax=Colwellia sp. KU-HH00111 TaxID=3127652 RepID=UPI00310816A9
MRFCFILLAFISLNTLATSSKFDCKYLDYHLVLETRGVEHIVHELKINGQKTVTELLNNHWFIEAVNCKPWGYQIIASHVQYNDPSKKAFMLTYRNNIGYKISIDTSDTGKSN